MAVGNGWPVARLVYVSLTACDQQPGKCFNGITLFGSAGGSCTMLTVLSLQIVIFWLFVISWGLILYVLYMYYVLYVKCFMVSYIISPWFVSNSELDWTEIELLASAMLWHMGDRRLLIEGVELIFYTLHMGLAWGRLLNRGCAWLLMNTTISQLSNV